MLLYLFKRFFSILVSLFVASVLIFVIIQLLPGDVAQMILGQYATPETLDALRKSMRLYDPIHVRYWDWIAGVLQGDLGDSLSIKGVRIADLLSDRGGKSFFLAFFATVVVVPLSIALGAVAGIRKNTWVDKLISLSSMAAISIPEFVSGVLLILVFSLFLNVLPSASSLDPEISIWSQMDKLVLPIMTLSLVLLGYMARMTRASVIDVASSNYVKTAVFKGLSDRRIIVSHILRNALIPSITIIAMNVGWMIGGLVVVESVFAYPGLGSLLLYSIVQRDVPLIQDTALFIVAAYMGLNFLADILNMLVNPRLRCR